MSARLGYVFLPRFPLQRLVLDVPSLSGKPVVFHEDHRGSQTIRFASAAAMKRGVHPGMTVGQASAHVPELTARVFSMAAQAQSLLTVGELLMSVAPGFQLDAPDGLWLDASAAHLFGGEAGWARTVLALVSQAGLRGRCVVASERFTAQAVARFGDEAIEVVPPQGAAMLAPLPLRALETGWLKVDSTEVFRGLGLSSLGELAGLASGALVARFGAMGLQASRLARGLDDSGFVATPLPEVLQEAIELDWPAEHLEPLLFALKNLIDRLCGRLQGRQLAAVQVLVTLLPSKQSVPLRLARPTSNAKLLLDLVRHQLTDLSVREAIAGMQVRIEETCAETGRQLMLGDAPSGEAELEVVLSRLQSALGPDALFSAVPLPKHRPEEAWKSTAFRPPDSGKLSDLWGVMQVDWQLGTEKPNEIEEQGPAVVIEAVRAVGEVLPQWELGQAPRSSEEALVGDLVSFVAANAGAAHTRPKPREAEQPQLSAFTMLARPPRLFREPSALQVDVTAAGVLQWVTMLGRRRRVQEFQGPERITGSWWETHPFARDYYRVQVDGVGALWVFRDGADGTFYVQGMFD